MTVALACWFALGRSPALAPQAPQEASQKSQPAAQPVRGQQLPASSPASDSGYLFEARLHAVKNIRNAGLAVLTAAIAP